MATANQVAKWTGKTKCDICNKQIKDELFDARIVNGKWATMDRACFIMYTFKKLGTGYGQRYQMIDKQFIKVEG